VFSAFTHSFVHSFILSFFRGSIPQHSRPSFIHHAFLHIPFCLHGIRNLSPWPLHVQARRRRDCGSQHLWLRCSQWTLQLGIPRPRERGLQIRRQSVAHQPWYVPDLPPLNIYLLLTVHPPRRIRNPRHLQAHPRHPRSGRSRIRKPRHNNRSHRQRHNLLRRRRLPPRPIPHAHPLRAPPKWRIPPARSPHGAPSRSRRDPTRRHSPHVPSLRRRILLHHQIAELFARGRREPRYQNLDTGRHRFL
jgi:hypothetical protein